MHISDAEKDYLRGCTINSASDIWNELRTRHQQKASTQTSLLDNVLSIRIDRDGEMVTKAAQIRNLCKHIFEIGKLDEDKFARVILLHAFSTDLCYIRDKHEDNEKSTPADIVQSLEKAKIRWEEETKDKRANAACTMTQHRHFRVYLREKGTRYVSTMTRHRYPGVWQVSKGHY
jgi:hypothetical protein